jgi:hypothetical protein
MAAKPIFVQAVDTNGTPYSGAKLNVYDAGTTTPRAIYTESGLGTASANPAIADANGVVVVWVNDAGGDIKVTLTNSAETVTPHNEDNIPIASLTCYPVITFQGDQSLLTTSSPTFAGLTLGNVSFAGVVTDPNADRLVFWDDSAGQVNFMTLGTGLAFNGTALELDGDLQDISGLTPTDGGVIIGDGTDFVIESGATLRTSIGLGTGDSVTFAGLTLASGATVTAILDEDNLASDSATAVPTQQSVKAYADSLVDTVADINAITQSDGTIIVSDGTNWVGESGAVARASLEVNTKYVASISALKALTGGDFDMVNVGGHTTAGDGGGGVFRWDGSDTTADDNGIYIQPNAGGTGRWIRQYDLPVNVRWFGATGDGTTDDAAAIQAALDTGVDVFIPHADFVTESAALTPSSNQRIYGAGKLIKTTAVAGYTNNYFTLSSLTGVIIDGLRFGSTNNARERCFYLDGCTGTRILNCETTDDRPTFVFVAKNSTDTLISGNTIVGGQVAITTGGDNVSAQTDGTVTDVRIIGNVISGTDTEAVDINHDTQGVTITGNTFYDCLTEEVIDIGGSTVTRDVTVSGNTIRLLSSAGNGIRVKQSSENVSITGNAILRTEAVVASTVGVAIDAGCRQVSVVGNNIEGVDDGIALAGTGVSDITIKGNTIARVGSYGIITNDSGGYTNVVISGNTIDGDGAASGASDDAIHLRDLSGSVVSYNTITDFGGEGIIANSDCDTLTITGNSVSACGRGIQNLATGSVIDGNATFNNVSEGLYLQATDCVMSNNVSYDNESDGSGGSYNIFMQSCSGSSILGNRCYDSGVNRARGLRIVGSTDTLSNMIITNNNTANSFSTLWTGQAACDSTCIIKDNIGYVNENIGTLSGSTDGSGDFTVTHGLSTTPTNVRAAATGTTFYQLQAHTIGATTFKLRALDAAGAAVTSTAVPGYWEAVAE